MELLLNESEIFHAHIAMRAVLMISKDGYAARGIALLKEHGLIDKKAAIVDLRSINKKFAKQVKEFKKAKII